MKTGIQKIANWLEVARMKVLGVARAEARRFITDNRGMTTVETIALTVVIAGAVIAAGTILNERIPTMFGDMIDKVSEMLGLS